jgi:hypothetical protein
METTRGTIGDYIIINLRELNHHQFLSSLITICRLFEALIAVFKRVLVRISYTSVLLLLHMAGMELA